MTERNTTPNPSGLCMCGCGRKTGIAKRTHSAKHQYQGEHVRYAVGHGRFKPAPEYVVDDNGCWVWQRYRDRDGYGQAYRDGYPTRAHRLYYERANGPIPAGLQIDHLCRNHSCVNPTHLEAVTPAENSRRGCKTKLNVDAVRAIRIRLAQNEVAKDIAREYNVCESVICKVRHRYSWKDVQ